MYPVASTTPGHDEKARDAFVNDVRDIAHDTGGLSVDAGGAGALATLEISPKPHQGPEVGIDAGVNLPLALSDGNHQDHKRPARLVAGVADFRCLSVTYGFTRCSAHRQRP
ncbi:hypothetical protein ACFRAO_34840 [Streptomyces sp. NPDC056656]|uniref:hypothetical protein n=1 Tax=Streptomyces sp. NPDC056656 TaxID=3345895 RepID=UPI0036CC3B30